METAFECPPVTRICHSTSILVLLVTAQWEEGGGGILWEKRERQMDIGSVFICRSSCVTCEFILGSFTLGMRFDE